MSDEKKGNVHVLWMGIRQVLIMALGFVEEFLGLPRSITPRRKRPRKTDVPDINAT